MECALAECALALFGRGLKDNYDPVEQVGGQVTFTICL